MDAEEGLSRALADRYRIEGPIGRGGMATVYLAHDLKHERTVALKVLDPALAETLGPERFLREIRTAAGLTHPHILPLHDSGEADGLLYYVMPYVKGESLRTRLDKEKQLPVAEAVGIAREIADALAHAHREGFVHRDVKPENILLEAGHAVLADFGVAWAVAEAREERLTRTGTSLGTPAYMSPEQAAGERDVDGRSDQYALGCVLYEMLAGQPPFRAAQAEAVLRQHLTAEPPPVTQVRPAVPEVAAQVLARSLAKSPADRYRTAEEFGAALEGAASGAPAQAKTRWGRTRAVVYAGTVVLALVTVGVMAAHWGLGGPELGEDARPGIAVLPCENLSARAEDAQYADALHNQILTKLQMVSGIVPTGLTSVMTYRDHPAPPARIAEELDVAYLGECSVQKEENRVQVAFRLVEARSGRQIWAELFDAVMEVGGIIDMQSEIALKVVDGVGARVTTEEQARIEARPTDNLDAYELYMIGMNRYDQLTAEKLAEAIDYFEASIREDSTFALAYAGMGAALVMLPIYDLTRQPLEVMEQARAAVTRALELDSSIGTVHTAMGLYLYLFEWDWLRADQHFLEALRLNPGDVHTHARYAVFLSAMGRVEEGADEARLVLAMDPKPSSTLWIQSNRLWQARRVDEARGLLERAIRIHPSTPWAFLHLAYIYAREDPIDLARAKEMMARFLASFGFPYPERTATLVEALGGDASLRKEATALLNDIVGSTILSRVDFFMEYAAIAPPEVFFDVLEEAVRVRHSWVPFIPIMIHLMNPELVEDSRWNVFMRTINHPGIEPS